MVGNSETGKTNIVNKYYQDKFNDKYKATIGANFLSKDINIDGVTSTFQIWDIAGQERFQSLSTGSFYYLDF